MRIFFVRLSEFSRRYPIVRGMASYTVIWPTACLIQQKVSGKKELNYIQAARFSLYGGFFVGPTVYAWLRIATYLWPKSNLRSAITKALVEQISYAPAAICCFFFGINLLELKPISECVQEVKNKFWPTYKVGFCVWPILQTINFVFVPERNRVVYVSICSLAWTSILSYMKSLEKNQLNENIIKIPKIETISNISESKSIDNVNKNISVNNNATSKENLKGKTSSN